MRRAQGPLVPICFGFARPPRAPALATSRSNLGGETQGSGLHAPCRVSYYEAGTLEPLPSANDCVARPLLV